MAAPLNIILLITDGHGHHTGDHDWGTTEYLGLRSRLERLELGRKGFAKFGNVMSPAASTIMSIESMLTGLHAAKTHKLHWREWPEWDRLEQPTLSSFLEQRGYAAHGFSYLLNAENWIPAIKLYRPELYRDFPSHKRDTHSHHAVLAAVRHYFAHAFEAGRPQLLMVHSIFLFDFWDELMELFGQHGLTDENTIFAFTSDHYFPKNFGRQWLLGERDGVPIYHHTDLTEHNTRVFLYLKAPGLPAQECDAPVSGCDLLPTLVDLLGLSAQWTTPVDGQSLIPWLRGASLPERWLRADNVYPYQIGEKQGRVTAIRCGYYKYVVRPDPASSYVAYRMQEPCGLLIESEEFYDLRSDLEETVNRIATVEPAELDGLARCRAAWRETTAAIFATHARGLWQYAQRSGLADKIAGGRVVSSLLCIQAGPAEITVTLLQVLTALFPAARVDLVARDLKGWKVPESCRVLVYPAGRDYEVETVLSWLAQSGAARYDALLGLGGTGLGPPEYYDTAAHPTTDYAAAERVLVALSGEQKGWLALNAAFVPLRAGAQKARFGNWAWELARALLRRFKPRLLRLVRALESGGPKMAPSFSARFIRRSRP